MTTPTLHVHFRRIGSDQAPSCPVTYDEATDRLQIDCGKLSPDLADLEARHQGDRYLLKNPHLTIPVSIADDSERFIVLEPSGEPGQFHPRVFPSAEAAHDHFVEQRRLEVTRPGGHAPGERLGTLLEVEIGGHGSVGEETAPFKQSSIREIRTEGEANAFTGGGITWALRLRAPRKTWMRWISPLVLSLQGAWTKGTVGDHYTAHSGEEGNWKTWHAGLAFGLQLDAQFFAAAASNVLLPWNLYLRYETPIVASRTFNAFAALNGRSLAEEFAFDDILTPGDQHRADLGFTYCVGSQVCLGLGLFFRQYAIDHGEVHFSDMDFGGLFTMNFLSPTGRGSKLPDEVGNTRVALTPLPMLRKAAPKPVPKKTEPVPKPHEPKLVFTSMPLDDLPGWYTEVEINLATGKADILPQDSEKVNATIGDAKHRQGQDRTKGLVDQKYSIRVEGHADTRGPDRHNKILALQRSHTLSGRFVERTVEQGLTVTKGAVSAVGYGEDQPLDIKGQIIPRGICKAEANSSRSKTDKETKKKVIVHRCRNGEIRLEDLAASRRAKLIFESTPAKAPRLQLTDAMGREQLTLDRQVGHKMAAALKRKFSAAVYDPVSNQLFLNITTLDVNTLKGAQVFFEQQAAAIQRKTGKVSFPVVLVLQMADAPPDYDQQVRRIFYNYRKLFPVAGGLFIKKESTDMKFAEVVQHEKVLEERAAARATALIAKQFVVDGMHIIPVALSATGDLSDEDIKTVHRIVSLNQPQYAKIGEPQRVTLIVNWTTGNPQEAEQKTQRLGFAVKSADPNIAGVFPGTNKELGNNAFLIFSATPIDLSKEDEPGIKALKTTLLNHVGQR